MTHTKLRPPSARNYLFFGFIADEATLAKAFASEDNPQVSAIKFQKSLLQGLAENGAKIDLLASLPIRSFPANRLALVRLRNFELCGGAVAGTLLPSINLPLLRFVLRPFLCLAFAWRELIPTYRSSAIIVYALHTPHLLAGILLGRLLRIPVAVFVPDLPEFMRGPGAGRLYRRLKKLENGLLRRLVKSASMVFPITPAIASDWLPPGQKHVVIEGIAPTSVRRLAGPVLGHGQRRNRPAIVYTGTFAHVLKFARLFADARDIDASLTFIGAGPEEAQLRQLAAADSRILVMPFMGEACLADVLARADYLVNPRDTQWAGSQFSFPSKLFDYMARGIPIISTGPHGIPSKYFRCFIEVSDASPLEFASSLRRALMADQTELAERVCAGFDLIDQMSPRRVGQVVIAALEGSVCEDEQPPQPWPARF